MKSVLLIFIAFISLKVFATEEYLQDDLPIREHMLKMDRHRDDFFAALRDPKAPQVELLKHLEALRIHLYRVFPKIPHSIEGQNQEEYQKERIEYQNQILKALAWTLEMEKALRKTATTEQEKERKDLKVKDLSHELNLIVGKGHHDFRE
ncbi:MAG: hypothetical protein KDD40_03130 [Bdellovibrionales bacterium]|nr:hypothetical protein [Bdellovibrionales bacterium]